MKTLIFDFGNVLAFFDHWRACRQLASLSTNQVTAETVYKALFCSTLESDFDSGKLSSSDFIQHLRRLFDIRSSNEAIVRAWCDMFWPNEHIISLLPQFKGPVAKLLLASNTNELHYQWFTKQFANPLSYFDALVLSYKVGYRKPALPFFDACIQAAEVSPNQCVYVDDRPDFVEVAQGMGMAGIVYAPDVAFLVSLRRKGIDLQ